MKKNNRTEAWRNAKRLNNLPKYEFGTAPTNRGFLLGASRTNNVSEYEVKPGQGLDNEVSDVENNMLPRAMQNVSMMLPMITPQITNTLSTSTAPSAAAVDTAASGITTNTADVASGTANAALGVGAKVLGGIGAAYGLYNMGDYLFGSKRGMSDSLMMDTVSRNREFSHGVGYDTYGNVNVGLVRQLGSAMKTADTVNQGLSGAGTGAAIGSFFSPIGTAIGAGIGALTGIISGIFGGNRRKRRMQREARLTNLAIERFNKQNEADATSEGIKREFYENLPTSALYGIDWSTKVKPDKKHPKFSMVESPEGVVPGPVKSIVGKGEGLINFNNGTASMVETGIKGKDTNYASIDPNDKNQVVLSNSLQVPGTNITIAQAAEPYIRRLPYAGGIEKSAIMDKLADYTNLQANMKRNTGKDEMPHYKGGTPGPSPWWKNKELWSNIGNYGLMAAPQIMGILGLIALNRRIKNARSWVPNSATLNEEAKNALNILASRRYKPYAQINAIEDATRGILWSTNLAGALSSSQRERIKNATVLNSAAQKAAIYDKAAEINNNYLKEYATAAIPVGEANAAREHNDTQWGFGMQQSQNGAMENLLANNDASIYGIGSLLVRDFQNYSRYKDSLNLGNRSIGIWESQAANDALKTKAYINSLGNTTMPKLPAYSDYDTTWLRYINENNINPFTGLIQTTF